MYYQIRKPYKYRYTYRYDSTGYRNNWTNEDAQKTLKKRKITRRSLAIVHPILVGEHNHLLSSAPGAPNATQIWRSPIT